MTAPGSLLSDIYTWVRRIVKPDSDQALPDSRILEYLNRFYLYHMPESLQLFELKRQFTLETRPDIFMYQFPFNDYQMVTQPCYIDGVEGGFYMDNRQWYRSFPEQAYNQQPLSGDGTVGPYTYTLLNIPIRRGFTDTLGNLRPYVIITAQNASLTTFTLVDDGEGGLLAANENLVPISPTVSYGSVNYLTGALSFSFDDMIPSTNLINIQFYPYQAGRPIAVLFYDNMIKVFPVPSKSYLIQLESYITPSQFLITDTAFPFSYMAEYIARGTARLILIDQGDMQQLNIYEKFFKDQENKLLRRTSKQNASQRAPTIFSALTGQYPNIWTQY